MDYVHVKVGADTRADAVNFALAAVAGDTCMLNAIAAEYPEGDVRLAEILGTITALFALLARHTLPDLRDDFLEHARQTAAKLVLAKKCDIPLPSFTDLAGMC